MVLGINIKRQDVPQKTGSNNIGVERREKEQQTPGQCFAVN